METIFRGKKWRLSISPRIASSGEELFDALATRDDSAVLFECKGTYVTSAQKYSRNPRQFFRGLSQKFGRAKHGGVFQLARGIARIWLDQTDTTDALQASQIRDVFPVLLVQDPILRCGPVARVLSDRFQTAIARVRRADGAKPPKIWPLTVMTADDLDRLASSVRATGQRVDALLKRFHRTHPSRMISLGDFLGSAANADFGFPAKVDALVKDRFRAASAATMQRFRASDYALTVRAETDG